MFEREIAKYQKLNKLAERGCTVILGSGNDVEIPIAELSDAFEIETKFYNRSAECISVKDAVSYYDTVVRPICPERIIIHIGEVDAEMFAINPSDFDRHFSELIGAIRATNPKCNIGIVSLTNRSRNKAVAEMNNHLRMIAESERCEFEDISTPRVWNPEAIKSAISFASAMGLSSKVRKDKSLYDLSKMFFCLDAVPVNSNSI